MPSFEVRAGDIVQLLREAGFAALAGPEPGGKKR